MFESDWGEQLQGVVCPVVVVVNVKTEECSVVDTSKMGDVSGGMSGKVDARGLGWGVGGGGGGGGGGGQRLRYSHLPLHSWSSTMGTR